MTAPLASEATAAAPSSASTATPASPFGGLPAASAIGRSDPRGCPVNTHSQDAIDLVEKATWRMLSYFGDPLADLDAAIAADPAWMLPHLMKANLLLTLAEHRFRVMAGDALRVGIEQNAGRGLLAREQAHLAATQACLEDRWHDACRLWDGILVDYPRDLAALIPAHLFDFYRGDSLNLRKRVARVLPAWSQSAPLYSYVLGQYAFGLEECNLYPQAREFGERALALEPKDPWAIHAVTHVNEMQGRYLEGAAWLREREADWAPDNGFAFHNWWHLALFYLERLDTATALGLLDERIAPGSEIALQHVDVAAMLWRLRLMGVDVGDRWSRLMKAWPAEAPDAGFYCFNDLHAVLACIGAERLDLAHQVLGAVRARADGSSTCAAVAGDTGVPLIASFVAAAEGRHDEAVDGLLAVRDTAFRFGGSHAQRDLIEQTLLATAIQAGRRSLARHLLNERRMAKPHSPLTGWWMERVG